MAPESAQDAGCGAGGTCSHDANGVVINFLGELQSADNILGRWSNVAANSPYAASAANVAKFYRAVE